MQKLEILNSRAKKPIIEQIRKQWNAEFKTDLVFLRSSKEKIYLINRDIERLDLSKLKVDSTGMYFCALIGTDIRLTIEGSEMIGKSATKNVLEIDAAQMRLWLKGQDLELDEAPSDLSGFVIIKCKTDLLGTGKIRGNEVLNFTPKNRRILS